MSEPLLSSPFTKPQPSPSTAYLNYLSTSEDTYNMILVGFSHPEVDTTGRSFTDRRPSFVSRGRSDSMSIMMSSTVDQRTYRSSSIPYSMFGSESSQDFMELGRLGAKLKNELTEGFLVVVHGRNACLSPSKITNSEDVMVTSLPQVQSEESLSDGKIYGNVNVMV
jgi:hypothetical protein